MGQYVAAPDGLGLTDLENVWVKQIAAWIEVQRRTGKTDQQIATDLSSQSTGEKEFGYIGGKLPAEWVNAAFQLVTPAGQKPVTVGMSTGAKVAIGVGIFLGAYLLLGRKR